MIDTIKIISMIDYDTFNKIKNSSNIKTSYSNKTGQIFYTVINGNLQGMYNSSLSIRVGDGTKYKFINKFYIEIEGSYHKFIKGYNSHNGFYNLHLIVIDLIKIIEKSYKVKLPNYNHWFLQRIDIAICYDLKSQENVKLYINNISQCNYPRRNLKYYEDECIYLAGSSTTLKIYNKFLEFKNNDLKNLKETNFNYIKHNDSIKGFIRFECEIKKRKLKSIYNKNYIRVNQVFYTDLKKVWKTEFEKFLKSIETDFEIVRNREKVKTRLYSTYSKVRAKNLFNFYILILARGINKVRADTDKSSYYKNISDLKKCGIDFSQKLDTNLNNNFLNFNPFEFNDIL